MVWNGQTKRKNCHPFNIGQKAKKKKHTDTCFSTWGTGTTCSVFFAACRRRRTHTIWVFLRTVHEVVRTVLYEMRFHGLDAVLDRPGTFVLDLMLGCRDLVFTRAVKLQRKRRFFPSCSVVQRCFRLVIVGFAALKHIFSQLTSTHLFAAYPEVSKVLLSCSNFP